MVQIYRHVQNVISESQIMDYVRVNVYMMTNIMIHKQMNVFLVFLHVQIVMDLKKLNVVNANRASKKQVMEHVKKI